MTMNIPANSAAPVSEASSPSRRRILVVDDNEDSGATLATWLQITGHEVNRLRDGNDLLAVVEAFRPEAILMDIGLPGMNGYELARQLRADNRFDKILLIAITGYGSPEDRQQSRDAGFNAHLVKPAELEVLLQLLQAPATLLFRQRERSLPE
jgi:CheY-like chemotaxis protein